jgi:enoyl-CoA hydratase/carnithine racemase
MTVVETERRDGIFVIRMNRPERLNALGSELRRSLAEAWCEFRDSRNLEVAIYTGTGRAFCVGEDMKESVERGTVGGGSAQAPMPENPYMSGEIQKPIIAAINGFAMGGGFMLAERADLGWRSTERYLRCPRQSGGFSAASTTAISAGCRIRSRRRWRSPFASMPTACTSWAS